MDIRDVVHGVIQIERHELPIIDSYFFQRLRQIKQTGFAEHSYPGATHNRYIHSLGALQTITNTFESIFQPLHHTLPETYFRFRALARFSALLHDVGHGPLSHTTEFAMPEASQLQVPGQKPSKRKANHEDYTLKIILDSPLTPLLEQATAPFGFKPIHIAAVIESSIQIDDDFFEEKINGETIRFRPILHQLISSELDADRMDYLRRDSFYCGVSYGEFDYGWLVSNLSWHIKDNSCYLALKHRALYSFEDFLLSRFHMFLMVYSHHKTVVYDEMLAKYLNAPDCDYKLPSDIEAYGQCTDAHLYAHLAKSTDRWARRISEKNPLRLLLETHSGIPSGEKAHEQQQNFFKKVTEELDAQKIEYVTNTSTSILSKYFGPQDIGKSDHPIYVRYDNLLSEESFIPLQKCTNLFSQYPNSRSISRIFVTPEDYSKIRKSGRKEQLNFD